MAAKNPFSPDGSGNGTSPNALVDQVIGTAYTVVRLVHDNLKYIKHTSLNLQHVVAIEGYLEDIRKVAQSITYVIDIGVNLQKLIEIHEALDVLKEIYAKLGLLEDIGLVLPQIKLVGDNINSVNTAAANIADINTVAANIAVIVEAFEGSKASAVAAAESEANAKTSEENAARDAQTASNKATHVDQVVAAFDVSSAQALQNITTAGTAGVQNIHNKTQTSLTALSQSAFTLNAQLNTATADGLLAIRTETNTSVLSIKAAHNAATTAIANARSGALTDIEASRSTAVGDVRRQGTTSVDAVKTQQETSVRAVQAAQTTATTAISTNGAAQLSAIETAGTTNTNAVNQAGVDSVAAVAAKQTEATQALDFLVSEGQRYADNSAGSATEAADSAAEAVAVFVKMQGGAPGQILAKVTATNYDYRWIDIPGGGDMASGTYDPNRIASDAFSMENMRDTEDFFRFTKAEKDRLANYPYNGLIGIPTEFKPEAHEHPMSDVIGLQDVLNTFVAGPTTAENGKLVVFSGSTGKQVVAAVYDINDVLARANHTGTIGINIVAGLQDALDSKAADALADTDNAGLMSALSYNRLAAMEDGATKNQTDAYLLARANHTGTQEQATINGLVDALAAKAGLAVASGTANGLMSSAHFTKLNGIEAGAQVNPDMALYQAVSAKGTANGYAGLDTAGKVPESQLPDTVLGALRYQDAWNAATNTPAIPAAAAANRGHYYMVQVAGSTDIDGETDWEVGDWVVSNGTAWNKIDNTDSVVSVAGLKGAIATAALQTALGLKTAAYTEASAYATAAEGALARSAVQPAGLTKDAVGLGKVENKTEAERVASGAIADKFASERTAIDASIDTRSPKASPAFTGNATFAGTIVANQNISAFSDRRLKSNIQTISNALDMVMNMRGTTYYKDNTLQYGVIAQEVETVVPELVYEQPKEGDIFWLNGQRPTLSVDTGNGFTAILIEAIKELRAEIDQLKSQIKG